MSEENSTPRPLAADEIAEIQATAKATREWVADGGAGDMLSDDAIGGMVDDTENLIATVADRDKTIADQDAALDRCMKERDDLLEFVEGVAALLGCEKEWSSAHDHLLCVKQAVMWGTGGEERAEVRKILEARDGETTPEALRRGLGELFEVCMRGGAKGMRDACAVIAGALSTSPNAFVAATSTGLRKAIEALPLP